MAEILLSLTIIGVVAAITLPSLTGNINERTWNTQRKALYARISQAIALMPSLNGYGIYTKDESDNIEDNAAATFISAGLSKVLKINNICSETLKDCGIPDKFTTLNAETISPFPTKISELNPDVISITQQTLSTPDTKTAAFETANGESIAVFYNPNCQARDNYEGWHLTQPYLCANFIYDLNGNKGPNTIGKDMGFITITYATDPIISAPMPLNNYIDISSMNINLTSVSKACTEFDSDSKLPTIYDLQSLFYNQKLWGYTYGPHYSSSRTNKADKIWYLVMGWGCAEPGNKEWGNGYLLRCIKR